MNSQQYAAEATEVARLVDTGEYAVAAEKLQAIIYSSISDLDKSLMCYNMAVICEKMNEIDAAFEWYDAGIAYEEPYYRFSVKEYKAAALAREGRAAESLALYEFLFQQPYLLEHEKDRMWTNINVLKNPRP